MLSEQEILEKIESGESSGVEFFDEQFVPNTHKDTLRRELYQRFIPKGVSRS